MSKETIVITLGVWVMVVPYLGVPTSWKTVLYILSGLVLVIVGFLLRTEALSRGGRRTEHQPFVENSVPPVMQNHAHDRKERITSLN